MVAYSFKAMFADQIERGAKRQTVRADRQRHARVGEAIQLYTAMRTRHCRKLVDPDPVCIAVQHIEISLPYGHSSIIAAIAVDGIPLTDDEIDEFAIADGFGEGAGWPRFKMGRFWLDNHGWKDFSGVLIKWGSRG
ncbi:ASCH domain-containing protein [Sphingopyxis granuli]|uniref:ASCH domain-containing protein n=1 Tax=Sphingopyxis granuli TaxID=267128 RepID=UPI001BAFA4F4|nr:ASCH domain-containing protein [Sphingopyxis granuli]QUM72212.1 ASCH domain-containing protein [Sphingopyxis granuli]